MPDVPAINLVFFFLQCVCRRKRNKLIFGLPCIKTVWLAKERAYISAQTYICLTFWIILEKYPKEQILGRKKDAHRTYALLLTEDRWGWEPCTGMLDAGTSSTWLPGGHPTGWEMAWTAKDEDENSLTNYLWSCHDSLQKLPYLSSSSWDIFTGDWFVAVCFFSNLESHPNTQALSNYHTYLAPK